MKNEEMIVRNIERGERIYGDVGIQTNEEDNEEDEGDQLEPHSDHGSCFHSWAAAARARQKQ